MSTQTREPANTGRKIPQTGHLNNTCKQSWITVFFFFGAMHYTKTGRRLQLIIIAVFLTNGKSFS